MKYILNFEGAVKST